MARWFMGTGVFASQCLRSLTENGIIPDLAVTMPPVPSGRRGSKLCPTPFETEAMELGIRVHRSHDVNKDPFLLELMESHLPQVIFVVDFGQRIGSPYLDKPPLGCLNVHPSLLPLYRGAAPIQRAVMEGKSETGVTVFRLVKEMDAGPVLLSQSVEIGPDETSGELLFRLAYIGGLLLAKGVRCLIEGLIDLEDQNSEISTYAAKIDKSEARINWNKPVRSVHNLVRAMNPQPGAYCMLGGLRLKIWRTEVITTESAKPCGSLSLDSDGYPVVQCHGGSVKLLEVQPQGRQKIKGSDWARGAHLKDGEGLS